MEERKKRPDIAEKRRFGDWNEMRLEAIGIVNYRTAVKN